MLSSDSWRSVCVWGGCLKPVSTGTRTLFNPAASQLFSVGASHVCIFVRLPSLLQTHFATFTFAFTCMFNWNMLFMVHSWGNPVYTLCADTWPSTSVSYWKAIWKREILFIVLIISEANIALAAFPAFPSFSWLPTPCSPQLGWLSLFI